MNVRNDVGATYATYGTNEKGAKRGRSPAPPTEYYKHANQPQGVYMPQKSDSRQETRRAVLWYNPAKYGTSPHQGWPMTSNIVNQRYPLPQNVAPPPHILHLNSEHQQPPPPQLVKQNQQPPQQKSGAISIEKIGDTMRSKLPAQQDFTIQRRIGNVNPQPGQGHPEFQNGPYHTNIRYE